MVVLRRHEQYATKADFTALSQGVKIQFDQLWGKTDRLEKKADRLEEKMDRLEAKTTRLEAKTDQLEEKVTHLDQKVDYLAEAMKASADECKSEISKLRADVAVLINSHKYVLWIGGGLATMCASVFGLCISILLPSVK